MRQSHLITGHIIPHPKILKEVQEEGWMVIFLHRDPRDTIVSMVQHWKKRPIWSPYCSWEEYGMNWDDPILWLIENIKPWFDYMHEWKRHTRYVMEYENLINLPHPQIEQITGELGLGYLGVVQRSKEKVRRFRKGGSGGWVNEFKPHHIERYNEIWEQYTE